MSVWKKLAIVFIPLIFLITGLIVWHIFLLTRNDGVIFKLGPFPALKLGIERVNVFTPKLEKSFIPVEVKGDPSLSNVRVRSPKYEQNVYVDYEESGKIYGRLVGTNEQRVYKWKDDTGYWCGTPKMMAVTVDGKSLDPQKEFPKYKFFIFGDKYRGVVGDIALEGIREDVVKGDGAKAYLASEVPNVDGSFDLVGLILFTTKDECYFLRDMTPEPVQK